MKQAAEEEEEEEEEEEDEELEGETQSAEKPWRLLWSQWLSPSRESQLSFFSVSFPDSIVVNAY